MLSVTEKLNKGTENWPLAMTRRSLLALKATVQSFVEADLLITVDSRKNEVWESEDIDGRQIFREFDCVGQENHNFLSILHTS